MTIEESLRIDDMHVDLFLRHAWHEAVMYELEQQAKEKERKERGEDGRKNN